MNYKEATPAILARLAELSKQKAFEQADKKKPAVKVNEARTRLAAWAEKRRREA